MANIIFGIYLDFICFRPEIQSFFWKKNKYSKTWTRDLKCQDGYCSLAENTQNAPTCFDQICLPKTKSLGKKAFGCPSVLQIIYYFGFYYQIKSFSGRCVSVTVVLSFSAVTNTPLAKLASYFTTLDTFTKNVPLLLWYSGLDQLFIAEQQPFKGLQHQKFSASPLEIPYQSDIKVKNYFILGF